jgi:hypothetical protein
MANKFAFNWDKVKEEVVESGKKKGFQADVRLWKPTVDDKGNATAIIRFLPDQSGTPFVKYYTHNFNYMNDGVKKYWIRNCINTFGFDKECPICKKNHEYYNSAFESDKAIAGQRKRKLVFMANILVIKNPANPEQEGKVYLYTFGQKIYEKIKDKMFPADDVKALGEGMYEEYVPFDLYEGANFKLVQVKQGEYPNYDKSEFGKQAPLGKDALIEKVMSEVYDLSEFMAEDKFPTNVEVVEKLGVLLGLAKATASSKPAVATETEPDIEDITTNTLVEDDIPFFESTPTIEPTEASETSEDDDFFKTLDMK